MLDPIPPEAPVPPQPQQIQTQIPLIYFNGFNLAISNADISIKLQVDSQDAMMLKISYTTAKTLAEGLTKLIERLETSTKHTFMTQTEIMQCLRPVPEKTSKQEGK